MNALAQARQDRYTKLERKALKRSRGSQTVRLRALTLREVAEYEARGWSLESTTPTAMGTATRYIMAMSAEDLDTRLRMP